MVRGRVAPGAASASASLILLLVVVSGCFGADPPESVVARPETIEEVPAIRLSPVREADMGDLTLVPAPAEEPVLLGGEPGRVVLADRGGRVRSGWPEGASVVHQAGTISAVASTADGGLWIAGSAGLVRVRGDLPDAARPWRLPDGGHPEIRALVAGKGDSLYATVDHGLIVLDPETGSARWLAGGPTPGWSDGRGEAAAFHDPEGLIRQGTDLIVADGGNHAIRIVSETGHVTTSVGGKPGLIDGPLAGARLRNPRGLRQHPRWGIIVCDTGNHALRRLGTARLDTLAGDGWPGTLPGILPDVRLTAPFQMVGAWLLGADGRLWHWESP